MLVCAHVYVTHRLHPSPQLECSEELGDLIKPLSVKYALSVYIRCETHHKVCFGRLRHMPVRIECLHLHATGDPVLC